MERYVQFTSGAVAFLLTNTFASDVEKEGISTNTKELFNAKLSKIIKRDLLRKDVAGSADWQK